MEQGIVITLLEVGEKEEGVVALHIPTGPLKIQDSNPVPTCPLALRLSHCAIWASILKWLNK